jgi:hypothetical protein
MRIHIDRERMAFLRSLGLEARPLWDAIEGLRTDLSPPGSFVDDDIEAHVLQVQAGQRTFWLQWSITQDRGETVIVIALNEKI